ncbi:MAG: lytic murein transglycosylase [Magnetococcales bacterium]|nr:lytic murein transglycosylase [Magnetococcales bacterium]MBF0161568.1 lytic murein transglycosylase [Magnetococcales bacterium]
MADGRFQKGWCRNRAQGGKSTAPHRHRAGWGGLLLSLFLGWVAPAWAEPNPTTAQPWLAEWVQQGTFEQSWLDTLLTPLTPDPQVIRLMESQAEAKPYYLYRKNFINDRRIRRGREQMRTHRALLQRIRKTYPVPSEFLVALWGVESDFGNNAGGFSVLRSLYTLAAAYPRRARFFQDELRHFLILCQEEGWDPRTPEGSFAGALGQMQMMPSTLRKYATDFNGNGKRDIFDDPADVLASIASFLTGHGWNPQGILSIQLNKKTNPDLEPLFSPALNEMQPWHFWLDKGLTLSARDKNPEPNEPAALIRLEEQQGFRYHVVFGNFKIITQWNRSSRFAMAVRELADQLRQEP